MPKTSIIIPNFNGLKLLRDCVASIRTNTDTPYEIIVVDNGSTDGSVEYCRRERLKFVSLPLNRGFPVACNYGLKLAGGDADTLLLLNNDTLVVRNWLNNMLGCLHGQADTGVVGPMTNYASGKQQMQEPYTSLADMGIKYGTPDPDKWQDVTRLVGLCLLFKREVLERVGLLDERFSPGHYEDDDFCYRARLAGYRLKIAGDAFIFHHGSASFRKEKSDTVRQLLARNRQLYMEKWGVDPNGFI